MWTRIAIFALLAGAAFSAQTLRLYLKDGTYQMAREYEVKPDRVRYYSTERGEWEEIPLEMIDLDRTKKEASDRESELAADVKAQSEEDAAERQVVKEIAAIPAATGPYYIHGEKLEAMKIAESKLVGNKKRSVLKVLSPVPVVSGKETVELDGESAEMRITDNKRPEFYFRLSNDDQFAIVRLTPKKGGRVVENVELVPISKEVNETQEEVTTFKKQVGDLLYKIWPVVDLEPGEYALVEFTQSKINIQTWDFGFGAASAPSDSSKKRK